MFWIVFAIYVQEYLCLKFVADFSLPSPGMFPNYTSSDLDPTSLSVFIQEPILPSEQNNTMLDVPNTVLGLDQLSVGLFSNFSLAPTLNLESSEAESFGIINASFTMIPATTSSSVSFHANESDVSHDMAVNQPISALNAVVDELDINNAQALLLQQMIHSDLVDELDLSEIMDDGE